MLLGASGMMPLACTDMQSCTHEGQKLAAERAFVIFAVEQHPAHATADGSHVLGDFLVHQPGHVELPCFKALRPASATDAVI